MDTKKTAIDIIEQLEAHDAVVSSSDMVSLRFISESPKEVGSYLHRKKKGELITQINVTQMDLEEENERGGWLTGDWCKIEIAN